jgi:pyruvate/2-oxoglutarate dehydrogenase complex dihydrolipoamide dehydrogenase (E3) component
MMFTHTAYDDFRVLESQLIGDGSRTTKRIVPYAMFTDPQLGRVGLTEGQARQSSEDVVVSCFEFQHNSRAHEEGETSGFIKLIANNKTRKLLGAAVLGHEAGELIHLYSTLMTVDLPYTYLRDCIFVHPTFGEAAQSALSSLP